MYLTPGDSAGAMSEDGLCRLIVVRGQKDKKVLVGDAEQQALLRASKDTSEGGELILATKLIPGIASKQWHNLKLRFVGSSIVGLVDGE